MILSLIVLGIGLLGIVFIKASSLSNQSTPSVVTVTPETPEIFYTIWTTKHPISTGDKISREDLRIEKYSEQKAFEYGIKQDVDIVFTEGMIARHDLPESSPILKEDIYYPDQDGYFNLIIESGYVPASIKVPKASIAGGLISSGSVVDLLVLTSTSQNLVNRPEIRDLSNIELAPLFMGIKVLQVKVPKNTSEADLGGKLSTTKKEQKVPDTVSVILQLTRKQVAELTIAKKIAQIEIHLSSRDLDASEVSADSGDVLSDYKPVREFRAQK